MGEINYISIYFWVLLLNKICDYEWRIFIKYIGFICFILENKVISFVLRENLLYGMYG